MNRLLQNSIKKSCTKPQAVAFLSGGVDSAVSAAIMKKCFNYSIQPVYVKNWDTKDETGNCASEHDLRKIERVLQILGITKKLLVLDCTKDYWQGVFEPVLDSFSRGGSLNADVLCNQEVKFGAWLEQLEEKLPETKDMAVITGHYARNSQFQVRAGINKCISALSDSDQVVDLSLFDDRPGPGETHPKSQLLQAEDKNKCQTLFLSKMPRSALQRTIFPLGNLNKNFVKHLASKEFGLDNLATQNESMGICFIGKRNNFGDFLGNYVPNLDFAGKVFDLKSGQEIGRHNGLHNFTLGQRPKSKHLKFLRNNIRETFYVNPKIKGSNCVVAGLDRSTNDLYLTGSTAEVSNKRTNPASLSSFVRLEDVTVYYTDVTDTSKSLSCQYMNRQFPIPCQVLSLDSTTSTAVLFLKNPARWVTEDQFFVLYDENEAVVLSGRNAETGPNYFELENGRSSKFRSPGFDQFWSPYLMEKCEQVAASLKACKKLQFDDKFVGMESFYQPR